MATETKLAKINQIFTGSKTAIADITADITANYPDVVVRSGDIYISTTSPNPLFTYNGTAWVSKANLQGVQGVQGIQGPQGTAGAKGETGERGPIGATPNLYNHFIELVTSRANDTTNRRTAYFNIVSTKNAPITSVDILKSTLAIPTDKTIVYSCNGNVAVPATMVMTPGRPASATNETYGTATALIINTTDNGFNLSIDCIGINDKTLYLTIAINTDDIPLSLINDTVVAV